VLKNIFVRLGEDRGLLEERVGEASPDIVDPETAAEDVVFPVADMMSCVWVSGGL
jgi:hypothetical protein